MKEFLSQRGVPYAEKYVDTDRAAAMEMIRRSGQQGVPVTIIGDEVVVGFDRARLERILASAAAAPSATGDKQSRKGSLGALVKDAGSLALHGGMNVRGAYIGGVHPGTPADSAGLRVGDVIVAVEGAPIGGVDELSAALKNRRADHVSLTLARGPNRREVTVQL